MAVGVGHAKIDCPNGACFNCGGRGHLSRECTAKVLHCVGCAAVVAVSRWAGECGGRETVGCGVCFGSVGTSTNCGQCWQWTILGI
jgi:hypothetical protein